MKKLVIVYIVLIVALILLVMFKTGGNLLSFLPSFGASHGTAEINGTKINLIIVKKDSDKQKGLSGRKSLSEKDGMLFVFDRPGKYGFWMKDMLFPIDIIYIDNDKVVYVVKDAPIGGQTKPLTIYRPSEPANYVLELNAGQSDKLKIQKGTTVKLSGIK